jgi:type I restriction-modification system DNA methylase subunit
MADLLRGFCKHSDYGKVILPFTVLRWLDWVLESTEDAVPAEHVSKDEGWAQSRAVPGQDGGADLLRHPVDGPAQADGPPRPYPR